MSTANAPQITLRALDRPWILPSRPEAYRGYATTLPLVASKRSEGYEMFMAGRTSVSPPNTDSRDTAQPQKTVAEIQKELMRTYPDEYVVVLGGRLLLHTPDKEKAFACWDAAWQDAGDEEPAVFAPAAIRERFKPIVRGRSFFTPRGTGR